MLSIFTPMCRFFAMIARRVSVVAKVNFNKIIKVGPATMVNGDSCPQFVPQDEFHMTVCRRVVRRLTNRITYPRSDIIMTFKANFNEERDHAGRLSNLAAVRTTNLKQPMFVSKAVQGGIYCRASSCVSKQVFVFVLFVLFVYAVFTASET